MRFFFGCAATLAVAATLCPAQSGTAPSPPLHDVYLVTIDTLRADHVHCYGDGQIQTPALDLLARDGVRFADAFTPSPITNTSHTSILTGLLPSQHGVTDFGIPLAAKFPTWAQLLKQNGYQTAAFIGAVVLDSRTLAPGLDRGFDYYDNFPADAPATEHWGRVERRGADVVHRAESWMSAHPQAPRFVWAHLYDPHDPYEPPPPYSQIYKDRLYDGEIAYADSALGNLLAYLKQHDRYRDSIIIVVGDHGEGLGEHGEETHGIFLYNSTTHVPLIVKLPENGKAGTAVDADVQTTDILPAVLDLLGIARPSSLSGMSLTPYLAGTNLPKRAIFGETDYPLRFGWAPLRAVRADGFKLIEAPKPELYDMASDPHELKNEYEPWNPNVLELRQTLAWSAVKEPAPSTSQGAAGAGTLSELRALGYLGPGDERTTTNVPELSSLPDPKDKIEEQNLLHSAMMLVDENRLAEAKPLFEKVVALDPESAAALRQLGEVEFREGDYRKAADSLDRAEKTNPGDASTAFDRGEVLEKLGDLAAARDALLSAIKLAPGRVDVRLLLASVYAKSGDAAAAEDQFQAAHLLEPENLEAALGLAKSYLAERDYSDAVDLLRPLAEGKGANAKALRTLADAYLGLGDRADAQIATKKAKALEAGK
jgi:arylsulfatase A-like enzyme/Flp pilus assembly protein TadD